MIKPSVLVIQKKLFIARGMPVILDVDVASLYNLSLVGFLNKAVKENPLPDDFLLRLNTDELPKLKVVEESFNYVLTEGGILMMPSLFPEEKFIETNIALLRAVRDFQNQSLKLAKEQRILN